MIREKAILSNTFLNQAGNLTPQHQIYSLKGLDRIWPHRVNSIRRLRYLYSQFAGFECDIRFDQASGNLYIAHDPDEISPLVFRDYLSCCDPAHKLFWLDVKNLDSGNLNSFCSLLQQLDRSYKIKNRIIIESPDTSALQQLDQLGWLCSLYLPSGFPVDTAEQTQWTDAINSFLKRNPGFISQDARLHDFMTTHFKQSKQLIWDIRFRDGMNKDLLLKRANDTSLLVCLINVKSPGYR